MKVQINENIYEVEANTPLKEVLLSYGFAFPCDGMGKCGKCRIKCKNIKESNLDLRFIPENARAEGWRIACDKIIDGDCVIEAHPPTRAEKVRELNSCNIAVSIGVRNIEIGIMDDEIAEKVTVKNPLYPFVSPEEYDKDRSKYSKMLRAELSKESIELFEKYGKAKAETFAIATNGYFAKILLGVSLDKDIDDYNELADEYNLSLPTESVYFLPIKDTFIGGDIFAETVNFKENTMLIDCSEIFKIISIENEDNKSAAMWDMVYDETGLKAVRAAIKVLRPEGYSPFVYLYGKHAPKLENILIDEGLTFTYAKFSLENVAKSCLGLRYRTRLNKEKSRTSVCNLLSNEKFHEYFSEY